ncbi:unnamed protein product [Cuscuta epithymum]|uniref:HAT C-terminal dimerisation domain-containing protein n=1 Tax=Cuscuta epithymum TaxID=186058 RepID=A0AAV0ENP8_9ASTE|nr:unnamed protein product [Cuscuta epithymum]
MPCYKFMCARRFKSVRRFHGGNQGGIRRIWGNGQLRLKWQTYLTERGVRYVAFPKDLSIRWNSTYKLLKVVLRYKEHFPAFLKEHDNYIINAADIDTCEKICNVLIYFLMLLKLLVMFINLPQTNLFHKAVNLADAFKEFQNAVFVHYFCDSMKEKFLKYYVHIPHIYGIAFILDPRYRLANLEDCFNFYYLAFFGEFPMYDDNPIDPKTEYNEVSTLFYALFNEFRAQYCNAPPPPSRTSSSKGKSIFKSAFGNLMKKTKTTHVSEQSALNEITLYLTYEVDFEENDDFDVLDWWKSKERTFPILARMAKQVRSMPISTVAVEQEFSSAGNVLTASRSRLSAESLETLICYHDWLKAARRTQEMSITPSQDFMDDSTTDGGSTYAGDSD